MEFVNDEPVGELLEAAYDPEESPETAGKLVDGTYTAMLATWELEDGLQKRWYTEPLDLDEPLDIGDRDCATIRVYTEDTLHLFNALDVSISTIGYDTGYELSSDHLDVKRQELDTENASAARVENREPEHPAMNAWDALYRSAVEDASELREGRALLRETDWSNRSYGDEMPRWWTETAPAALVDVTPQPGLYRVRVYTEDNLYVSGPIHNRIDFNSPGQMSMPSFTRYPLQPQDDPYYRGDRK